MPRGTPGRPALPRVGRVLLRQSFLLLPFRRCSLSTIASHAPDDGAVDTADVSRTRVITGGAFETRQQAADDVRVDRRQAPRTAAPTPRNPQRDCSRVTRVSELISLITWQSVGSLRASRPGPVRDRETEPNRCRAGQAFSATRYDKASLLRAAPAERP